MVLTDLLMVQKCTYLLLSQGIDRRKDKTILNVYHYTCLKLVWPESQTDFGYLAGVVGLCKRRREKVVKEEGPSLLTGLKSGAQSKRTRP